ncbi:hypothetical protein PIB30_056030 [Stylosanthes scabra]|uniref:Uncharacterized protein n=1 Tax=Stylosanthes scabra TaxID=79078 RepID=A0ABU6VHT7_9FABA|nr:hypothetical protein [Stylosanthes scabra]
MRRTAHICVEGKLPPNVFKNPRIGVDISQQLTPMRESGASSQQRSRLSTALMQLPHSHASKQGICVEQEFKPSLSYEDPRIGVEVHAYAWKMQQHSKEQQVPCICVESYAYAWETE